MADDDTYVFGSDAAGLSELEFWKAASNSGHVDELLAFLAAYPSSPFADLARLRLARLDTGAKPVAIASANAADGSCSQVSRVVVVDGSGTIVSERTIDVVVEQLAVDGDTALDLVAADGGVFEMGATNVEALAARRELQHAAAATALRWIQEEQPRRVVTVSSFRIGRVPVTQRQWEAGAALPIARLELARQPSEYSGPDNPVERVSWHEAVEFCERVSIATGRTVRLPSEAEWEFACRGGTDSPFAFGDTLSPDLANYQSSEKFGVGPRGEPVGKTTPVDSHGVSNALGLVDVHGNVWEWCRDWHARDTYSTTAVVNPSGPCSGMARVRRGGSWRTPPVFCRSAARFSAPPGFRHADTGFRIVVESS